MPDSLRRDDTASASVAHNRLLAAIAAAFVALQVAVTALGPYGYFIDEFYYIACARRPAFGYVDHPPLAPLVLSIIRLLFGESLLAIRFPAFLLGRCRCLGCGAPGPRIRRRPMGGRRGGDHRRARARRIAMSGFFSVNIFEVVAWVFCTWAFVRSLRPAIRDGGSRSASRQASASRPNIRRRRCSSRLVWDHRNARAPAAP